MPAQAPPPTAPIRPKVIENHGDRRIDNYFWLRDKSNPEVIAHLEAENRYTESQMKATEALQSTLYQEIVARIQEDDTSAPTRRGNFAYYTRTRKGQQYPTWCRRQGATGSEQVLLDGNELARGHKYFQVGSFSVSPDQKLLAYGTDTEGDEILTVRVKDLATGQLLPDQIGNANTSLVWAEDNKTLFYNVLDAAKRPYKAFRHTLGQSAPDTEVYHETDERFTVEISKTRSKAFILLQINSAITGEVRYLPAAKPSAAFTVLYPRTQNVEYDATHHAGSWYVRINDTGRTFRLIQAPLANPARKKELIPARADVTLEDVGAFADHLVITERQQGLLKLRIRRLSNGAEHFVSLPEPVYTLSAPGGPEFDTTLLRFNYTSLVTPPSTFDYDMNARTRTLVKQQPVLGGFDSRNYTSERIFATAADGTRIPVSLVYRKGLKKDGAAPALLYGYGSYGIPSEPNFSSERLSLLDRGFVYAIAHIRGGSDLGKTWHDAGKMLNKRTTFTDFIAAAEFLSKEKYTQPKRLAIMGGSAGGLLMGAVTNMRPDLFGAIIAKVPFVDVLSTMMDATLPLTVGEYEEWGNPADERAYRYMRSYSPYDNVESQIFPNMLVTAGLNDPRVSYWEPAKWVAKLRTLKKDNHLLLLKTNMGAGHFGASGRYERYKETAFDYAFLFQALGVANR
jgi:oligopeptidase B